MYSKAGKFLIYVPNSPDRKKRLDMVSKAVSKVAVKLGAKIEISETDRVTSPYVFYLNKENAKEMPIYCDLGKDWDEEKIYNSIRSIVYALSFLPQFNSLQFIRKC